MRLLLDTDVLSGFRRRKPHPALIAWARSLSGADLAVSVVTVAEIVRGAEIAGRTSADDKASILSWMERILASQGYAILPLDVDAARIWGRMIATPALHNFLRADPRQSPRTQKTGADLMIAATAIATNRTLVSLNTDHMLEIHRSFPLPGLHHPIEGIWHVPPREPSDGPG